MQKLYFVILFLLLFVACEQEHIISDFNQKAVSILNANGSNDSIIFFAKKNLEQNLGPSSDYYSNYLIAYALENEKDYLTAFDHYITASKLIPKEEKFDYDRYWILNNLGRICKIYANYNEAIDYYNRALKFVSEKDRAGILYNIGNAYKQKKDLDNSSKFYLQALESAESTMNMTRQIKIYTQIGTIYRDLGDTETAISYFENVLETASSEKGISTKYSNIVLNYLGNIYKERGEYDKAIEYFNQALNNDIRNSTKFVVQMDLGDCYLTMEKYNEAINYLSLAQDNYQYVEPEKDYFKVFRLSDEAARKVGNIELENSSTDIYYAESDRFMDNQKQLLEKYSAAQLSARIDQHHMIDTFENIVMRHRYAIAACILGLAAFIFLCLWFRKRYQDEKNNLTDLQKNIGTIGDMLHDLSKGAGR